PGSLLEAQQAIAEQVGQQRGVGETAQRMDNDQSGAAGEQGKKDLTGGGGGHVLVLPLATTAATLAFASPEPPVGPRSTGEPAGAWAPSGAAQAEAADQLQQMRHAVGDIPRGADRLAGGASVLFGRLGNAVDVQLHLRGDGGLLLGGGGDLPAHRADGAAGRGVARQGGGGRLPRLHPSSC